MGEHGCLLGVEAMGPEWAEGPPSPWGCIQPGCQRSRGVGEKEEAGEGVPSPEQGSGVCSGVGPTERYLTQQGQEGVPWENR